MNKKETVIKFEKDISVPNLGFNLDFDDYIFLKHEFKQKLKWFEDEFDELLGSKTHNTTKKDIELVNEILDRLSETINEYRDEKLLFKLVSTLNKIEKKGEFRP
ncbi:unnamed protein product, partial [marine sediment metagenome]